MQAKMHTNREGGMLEKIIRTVQTWIIENVNARGGGILLIMKIRIKQIKIEIFIKL